MTQEKPFKKYKQQGAGYHWSQISHSLFKHNPFVAARFRLLMRLIRDQKWNLQKSKVLDIGCGDGVFIARCARLGAQCVGIDTSPEAIAYARQKCEKLRNASFKCGSVYELPFNDRNFDFVISSELIEHLQNPERMLQEVHRVWNGKGAIIITTPIRMLKYPFDQEHVQEFFVEDFQELIASYFGHVTFTQSHPLFWKEFQQRLVFGKPFGKLLLNILDIFTPFNPFLNRNGWHHHTIQIAIVTSPTYDDK